MKLRKMINTVAIGVAVLLAVLQFVRPDIPARRATAEVEAPPAVRHILEKSCYGCHSYERRLAWFDEIQPGYWLVRHDILTARERLNFSTLGSHPSAEQKAKLYEAVNMIQLGAMPLPRFASLHPEARVTPEDLATLKTYLAPWKPMQAPAQAAAPALLLPPPVFLATVRPEPNGLQFDPDFKAWKLISFTDRGDNGTFRFVLANDIAVKAALSGTISPWPDGARFAKIAWKQETGSDGLLHPGAFVQVELMVKDAKRYKASDGWSWGRWRGPEMQPYGKDAQFVNECTGCHMPVRGDDYVYTMPMTTVRLNRQELVNNAAAALPGNLPWNPLGWSAITMFVDSDHHSIAVLYGNDVAMQAIHQRGATSTENATSYPTGAVLALITWAEREDPHWFGARIPDVPESVEFVETTVGGQGTTYRYKGAAFAEEHLNASARKQRTEFILHLDSAPLP